MTARSTASFLLVKARSRFGAIRLGDVAEIMRPLPVEPLAGMPAFLLGLSVIRGTPVPVVDLGALLGSSGAADTKRYVTLRIGTRRVALAVEDVLGVRDLDSSTFERLPPLHAGAHGDAIHAVGALDRQLLVVLEAARVVPDEVWRTMSEAKAS